MSLRRMLPFIFINIVVSAAVVLLILTWWERRQENAVTDAAATAQVTPVLEAGGLLNPPVAPDPTTATQVQPVVEESTDGEIVYVVQTGDTLGSIAAQLDVSIDDLIAANELENPDFLAVGQELVIPGAAPAPDQQTQPEEPSLAPTATAAATGVNTPVPAPTEPLEQGVVIVEIAEVVGTGVLAEEAISIANFGDRAIALQGWELSDEQGRVYRFGQVTLFGEGAAILIHTETGRDGPSNLFWGLEEPIWNSGETVTLRDATGTVQATYIIP